MSYCRWSCMDFQSDVYAYESDSGYEIHVAGNRVVPAEPLPPRISYDDDPKAYFARHSEVTRIIGASEHVPIGLPLDGESFTFGEPGEAADKLEEIRALGYNVPQYAIDDLRVEAACETSKP